MKEWLSDWWIVLILVALLVASMIESSCDSARRGGCNVEIKIGVQVQGDAGHDRQDAGVD